MMTGADGNVLTCRNVVKHFGTIRALDGFDLDLRDGVLMALLGPSGCGKTTALRAMAGFERPESGDIWVGDGKVTGATTWVPPEARRIGMVFQDWALFPHLDVWHNVAFGLRDPKRETVGEILELVHLSGLEKRMPHELSGGQQQRIALARALAPRPEVILLDEPFSNLDASLRVKLRLEVRQVLKEANATAIFVTHDQEEALSMADELAVMDHGAVLQAGTPHEVYGAPATRAIAALVGEANFVPGRIVSGKVVSVLGTLPAPGLADGPVDVMVRPEAISVTRDPNGNARIVDAEFYGHDQLIRARLNNGMIVEARLLGPRPDLHIGADVALAICAPAQLFRVDDHTSLFPYCGIDRDPDRAAV